MSKVTKVKSAPVRQLVPLGTPTYTNFYQARWNPDELHRHPDFAPIKKETTPPKPPPQEDDDLPPRPADAARPAKVDTFDGDGEFGSMSRDISSDLFPALTGNR